MNQKKKLQLILFSFVLFLSWNCSNFYTSESTNYYLHLSHTRTEADDTIDSTTLEIDYDKYDMLWLGGDLTYYTSKEEKTIHYVDSIFSVKDKNTLWALGNHDYSNKALVQKFTKRPPYYSFHRNGITFLVLDTQDSLSNITGLQKDLFHSVIDTLQESSHLIMLHHKLIWLYGDSKFEPNIFTISNAGLGDCFVCLNPNNFYSELYPELVKVKEKGIEVLAIGGDIGTKIKEFEYETPEGIHLLASGIESGEMGNKALVFKHNLVTGGLTWSFQLISTL